MLMSGRNAYGFSLEYVKISLNLHVELFKVPFVKSLSHFHDNVSMLWCCWLSHLAQSEMKPSGGLSVLGQGDSV